MCQLTYNKELYVYSIKESSSFAHAMYVPAYDLWLHAFTVELNDIHKQNFCKKLPCMDNELN